MRNPSWGNRKIRREVSRLGYDPRRVDRLPLRQCSSKLFWLIVLRNTRCAPRPGITRVRKSDHGT